MAIKIIKQGVYKRKEQNSEMSGLIIALEKLGLKR